MTMPPCKDTTTELLVNAVGLRQQLDRAKKQLEIAVDVLKEIDELLSSNKFDVREVPLLNITQTKISMLLTTLEQKDKR